MNRQTKIVRSIKTGGYYRVHTVAVDQTTGRENQNLMLYSIYGTTSPVYAREMKNFLEKFVPVSEEEALKATTGG